MLAFKRYSIYNQR